MKSEARVKKSFIFISTMIMLCIFLTGTAIAQRINVSEAIAVPAQEYAEEPEEILPEELLPEGLLSEELISEELLPEELLPEELISEPPTGYLERDYRILTQEYGTAVSSTVTIIRVGEDQGPSIMDINPLVLDSEPILIAPGPTNKTISAGTMAAFSGVFSPFRDLNGYSSDFSSIGFGVNDIFRYNRVNNYYNNNYGYNFNYNLTNNPLLGWYGLPYGHGIISGWLGNTYDKYNGHEEYLPNSYFHLIDQFIGSKRSNNGKSGNYNKKPDPAPTAQFEEADVSIYADADGSAITLVEGETLSIVLESNITTGYRWDLNFDLLDPQVLEQINAQYISGPFDENEPLLGAPGCEQWIFQATGAGTTIVELNYKRSWEEDIIDTFTIEVIVEPAIGAGGGIGLANPASVYCIENGGISEIRTNELGSYGVCIFSDGTECEEWAYFRGECGQ